MKCLPEVAEHFRWRNDDQLVEAVAVGKAIKRLGNDAGEPLFCDIMPVDLLHRTAGRADALDRPPGTISSLFARCRIILLDNLLYLQVEPLRGAFIA
jgi:hypothetical protein